MNELDPLRPLAGSLKGLKVLDFTQNLPGPYCTMLLAALGAEVVKVEPPRGEPARVIGGLFDLVNGNKLSVTLDLKDEADLGKLASLVTSADVLVEGFRPGVMDRFGWGASQAREANPELIYCSISGFGQQGPYRDRPAHDLNFQALTGVCHMMRDAEDTPRGAALPLADLSSSMTAFGAITTALYARERGGGGRTLDVAMTDTLLSWAHLWSEGLTPNEPGMGAGAAAAGSWVGEFGENLPLPFRPVARWIESQLSEGRAQSGVQALGRRLAASKHYDRLQRVGLHALPHYGIYKTRDKQWLSVGIVDEHKFWRALCKALGLGVLGEIPLPARFLVGPPLRRVLSTIFARHDMAHWLSKLDPAVVPVAPVLTLAQALADPQIRSRLGPENHGGPAPLRMPTGARAPTLGEHNDEVFARWGAA